MCWNCCRSHWRTFSCGLLWDTACCFIYSYTLFVHAYILSVIILGTLPVKCYKRLLSSMQSVHSMHTPNSSRSGSLVTCILYNFQFSSCPHLASGINESLSTSSSTRSLSRAEKGDYKHTFILLLSNSHSPLYHHRMVPVGRCAWHLSVSRCCIRGHDLRSVTLSLRICCQYCFASWSDLRR